MIKIFEEIEKYAFITVYVLFSIFVVSISPSPVIFSKLILLTIFATLGIVIWSVRGILKSTLSFATGKFDLPILLVLAVFIASAIFRTPNKMEAFLFPGSVTLLFLSVIFYFLINQLSKPFKNVISSSIFISGLLLALSLIFTQLGIFNKIPQLPQYMKDASFNPIGGSIPSVIYLFFSGILGLIALIKDRNFVKKVFWGTSLGIILIGFVISFYNVLPNKPQSPKFPSIKTSWEITIDTLKVSPLLGAGAGNYLSAFNLYRPVTYNQTDLWQVRFTTASNFLFTFITEVGLLGLLAIVILIISIYKSTKSITLNNIDEALPAVSLVVLLLLPTPPTLLFLFTTILAIYSKSENRKVEIEIPTKVPSLLIGSLLIVATIVFDFYAIKYAKAEYYFKNALDSISKNDAQKTYDYMQKAIQINPNVDRYHASLAQINMAIASSLASQKQISDNDRQTITQLVQNAIAEGKSTAVLNPQRSGNWEVLAQIYRSIMSFAQGADQFAVQTYTQAVALDPTNPNLRIALGGVYYALGRFDDAIDSFKLSVLAKSDLANAHYNLAIAYREKKDFDSAINEMNAVLSLVVKDSEDYTLAQNILNELKKNKVAKTTESGDDLKAPQSLEKTTVKPPIELPAEATPPQQ